MADEACEFPAYLPTEEKVRNILERHKTIAVVGLSKQPEKPSHFVPRYLQQQGYKIIPVNPTAKEPLLGETVYRTLREIPQKVEVVNIFRPAQEVPAIVKEALSLGVKVIWMQEGIVHNEAAKEAMDAGLSVVMNRCMMKEHRRLKGFDPGANSP
jgi:predicted CoA-binding protein